MLTWVLEIERNTAKSEPASKSNFLSFRLLCHFHSKRQTSTWKLLLTFSCESRNRWCTFFLSHRMIQVVFDRTVFLAVRKFAWDLKHIRSSNNQLSIFLVLFARIRLEHTAHTRILHSILSSRFTRSPQFSSFRDQLPPMFTLYFPNLTLTYSHSICLDTM